MTARANKDTTHADVRRAARRLGASGGAMSTADRLDAIERFLGDVRAAHEHGHKLAVYQLRQLIAHALVLLEEHVAQEREARL